MNVVLQARFELARVQPSRFLVVETSSALVFPYGVLLLDDSAKSTVYAIPPL